jgi:hypothetical protein
MNVTRSSGPIAGIAALAVGDGERGRATTPTAFGVPERRKAVSFSDARTNRSSKADTTWAARGA